MAEIRREPTDLSIEEVNSSNTEAPKEETAEILYQRLGNRWYAFSVIDEEVWAGVVEDDEVPEGELEV